MVYRQNIASIYGKRYKLVKY